MRIKVVKCKIMHMGRKNQSHDYVISGVEERGAGGLELCG